jgi:hypothetical protein
MVVELGEQLALANTIANPHVETFHDTGDSGTHANFGADARLDNPRGFNDRSDIAPDYAHCPRLSGATVRFRRGDATPQERRDTDGSQSGGGKYNFLQPLSSPLSVGPNVSGLCLTGNPLKQPVGSETSAGQMQDKRGQEQD